MSYNKYEGVDDKELILRYREGESDIIDYIMEKYKNIVRGKAKAMFILGADNDDLIQEGMIGLFKAIRDYDTGRDASFHTFAELCISRQIYTAVQASRRQKHIPLNNYISIYGQVGEGYDEEDKYLIEVLHSISEQSPEEMFIDMENINGLELEIEEILSPLEKQVLELHLTGMSYVEIAKVLGRDEKSTDNALQRVRGKIKKIVDKMNKR